MKAYLEIEMPLTCEECHLESFCDRWVEARKMSGEWKIGVKATIRHPDCPLVPVPPHGRLIDADALEKSLVTQLEQCTRLLGLLECVDNLRVIEGQREVLEGILEEINNALTVIPADEEERRNVE